jgi:glycosyltransferase involved in cell wall biosynthesis
MKLSVVIPVYNERDTLPVTLGKVVSSLPGVDKDIVIVDDGSTDGTREWLAQNFQPDTNVPVYIFASEQGGVTVHGGGQSSCSTDATVRVFFQSHNQGKGAALRRGFAETTGEVIVVQDADLEYDPADLQEMWRLVDEGWADVVYGSRFFGKPHRVLYYHHYLGNWLISFLIRILCNITLNDIECCYKMFRREVLADMTLVSNDFGIEVELTVKMAMARRWRIYESTVAHYGRTYKEGKKINWIDGVKALYYIAKFRWFA